MKYDATTSNYEEVTNDSVLQRLLGSFEIGVTENDDAEGEIMPVI